jgi:hypothetical protein
MEQEPFKRKTAENIEKKREELAQIVKLNLEKYNSEIKDFSLLTTSREANGGFPTNPKLPPVDYSSNYDSWYEFTNLPRVRNYFQEGKSGYVVDVVNNWYTFVGSLGRALHTPDRPGNSLVITLRGEKGKKLSPELVDSLKNLIMTIVPYQEADKDSDLKNILTESIPVLEAFEELEKKFPSIGKISIAGLIKEYKEMLNEF